MRKHWVPLVLGTLTLFIMAGSVRGAIRLANLLYHDRLSNEMLLLWHLGVFFSNLAPPLVAALFWTLTRRIRHAWLPHLLLVPAVIAILRCGNELALYAAGEPDLDGPTGWATVPGILLLLVSVVIYYGAVLARSAAKRASAATHQAIEGRPLPPAPPPATGADRTGA